MSIELWHRWRRRTALAAAAGAAVLAALTAVSAATAATASKAASQTTQSSPAGTRAQVPWSRVGPGWELVQYTTRPAVIPVKPGPVTLYLVGPNGARYSLYRWRASATQPALIAWSGDKTRALLRFPSGKMGQLTLATGRISTFTLAGHATPLGYTRPSGLNILGVQQAGNTQRLARFSLTGQLLKVLVGGSFYDSSGLYSADGTVLAVPSGKGLLLVSNRGGIIRSLPAGGAATAGCRPARWWNTRTVLASCFTRTAAAPRLWLVPVSGARPVAITPQRGVRSPDAGDLDGWRLPSGLYLQGAQACGTVQIFRQAANGSITVVPVPGATGNDNMVVTASGSRLLVQAQTSCEGSNSLLWFNPATRAEQWLLHTPPTEAGVQSVVAYYSQENAS